MRVDGVVAAALLVTVAACGRSPLGKQRSANANQGGNSAGGIAGTMNGTGGHPLGTPAGTGGAPVGNGGTTGSGGTQSTGGRVGTGGTGGTAGANRTGGAMGSGGTFATGGTRTTGGSSGVGGAVGTGGFIRTGGVNGTGGFIRTGGTMGSTTATGGVIGVGGATLLGGVPGGSMGSGGRLGSGGALGGTIGTGGRSGSGGAVSSGGTTTSGGTSGTGGSCGNGTVAPVEQCDLGTENKTLPAFSVTQAGQGFAATPLVGTVSCPYFYSYSSSSAHTGFEALGTSRILLYIDKTTLALSLAFVHGVDKDSTGLEQPTSRVVMWFSGLPDTTTVGESDDPDELIMTAANTATASWKFVNNSDGGVLYRLPFPGDWEITIQPSFLEGISVWTWVQGDGSFVNLDLTQPLVIKANNISGTCRLDCTAPHCGDGILDGGEICDDGSQPRTGCLGDCMSFDW